jgi:hypothetical protein
LMPKGEWTYRLCVWNNELELLVFEFGNWLVITLNSYVWDYVSLRNLVVCLWWFTLLFTF